VLPVEVQLRPDEQKHEPRERRGEDKRPENHAAARAYSPAKPAR
jgi:hypothetical protein